jgi:hypothetical protein
MKYGLEESIIKKGVDIKKRKPVSLSKAEMTKLALLRNPKADPKVLKDLKDIKKNYDDKIEEDIKKKKKEE